MEEVKAYIESGILELYVLGQLTDRENAEVEAMSAKHQEIKAEIAAIEFALESYAQENSVRVPLTLEDKILSQLNNQGTASSKKTKIVQLYNNLNDVRTKALQYALAACIILLIACAGTLYSLYHQLNTAKQAIAELSTQREQLAKNVSKLTFQGKAMESRIAMTETTEWKTVKLSGVKNSPNSSMLIYWNKENKSILINYAAINLPKTKGTDTYQLWALVDGKPVSLGIFDDINKATEAVKPMQSIERAQAFAVTMEPSGGRAEPTMEKMLVLGAI